jgi:hypothetical protein
MVTQLEKAVKEAQSWGDGLDCDKMRR